MPALTKRTGIALLFVLASFCGAAENFDLVIYGTTPAGIGAAIEASRTGKSCVLIEPGRHLGGMTAGGLGRTDTGNTRAIGGIALEFYRRVGAHYGKPVAWEFEPHVAEDTFKTMLGEAKIPVIFGERLDLAHGVDKRDGRIAAIAMESGRRFEGKVFIDATYEGDLMAKAGVTYRVGRESNATYGETLNGVQVKNATKHQFDCAVDPYVVEGDPKSGLLPGIHEGGPGEEGSGDRRVQAYNFRMCLTNNAANRITFPKPSQYDPLRYEILFRYLRAGHWTVLKLSSPMPNAKTDTNNHGAFASDNIGMNYEYPDGDYATRQRIVEEHKHYQQGMMWFLANDPRVPVHVHDEVNQWGLCKDEFTDNGGWPHQLYIREARRMVSGYVMTQHNCQGRAIAEDGIGLAAYGMDSHNVQRYAKDGRIWNEGDVQVHGFTPYPIAYRAICPKRGECTNLLVPVCLSASHIAYGSIRMEPVFMVLGQSAAAAACMAIDKELAVQEIDVNALREKLFLEGQILAWMPQAPTPPL